MTYLRAAMGRTTPSPVEGVGRPAAGFHRGGIRATMVRMLREKHTPPRVEGDPDGAFVDLSADNPTSTLNRVVVIVWVLSLLVVIGVGVAHVAIMRRELRDHEIQRAVEDVQDRVDLVLEHSVPQALIDGDPAAIEEFDAIIREHIVRPTTAGLALWSPDGRILYALDPQFTGTQHSLPVGAKEALDTNRVVAGLRDSGAADADAEAGWAASSAIEVYAPFANDQGDEFVWEVGLRRDRVTEQSNRLVLTVALLTALGTALLLTIQGLLARNLVRRHDREQSYRRWITQRVSEVATVERRQIAADLHDGVVQDLTGIALDLEVPIGKGKVAPPLDPQERSSLATRIRAAVTVLRGQAAELHPVASSAMEVETSLRDMLGRVPAHIATSLVVEPGTEVAPGYRWLVFRVAQEALRNVVQHSRATRVVVAMRRGESGTVITIDDDGVGFSPEKDPIEPGHMGLSLLSDMASAAGGVVFIRSAPGKGTTIRLEVPE